MLPVLLIGLLILWTAFRYRNKNNPIAVIKTILPEAGLDSRNVRFWIAVSAHETAYDNSYQTPFTSPVFKENNNLFGMRLASGNTTAIGSNLGHAVYSSLSDSAKDLVLYFERLKWTTRNFDSIESLCAEMKRKGYFTADLNEYTTGVNYWYKKLSL